MKIAYKFSCSRKSEDFSVDFNSNFMDCHQFEQVSATMDHLTRVFVDHSDVFVVQMLTEFDHQALSVRCAHVVVPRKRKQSILLSSQVHGDVHENLSGMRYKR